MRRSFYLLIPLSFVTGFLSFLYAMPYLRTHKIIGLISRQTFRENFLFRVPRLDHTERRVQRVSPDLHYSYCLINVEDDRLVRLKLSEWPYYQSAGFYKLNGDYVASWHPQQELEIVISQDKQKPAVRADRWVIQEGRGLLVIRRLVPAGVAPPQADSCGVVNV